MSEDERRPGGSSDPLRYRICGGVLESDLEFAELPLASADAVPDWTLHVSAHAPPELHGVVLGQDEVTASATVQLVRAEDRLRLAFTDTGTFDVLDGGRTITWYPLPDSDRRAAALDVVGRVLAVSFHAAGFVCLHGSAVALERGTVAFMAPKFHGKSTTAMALTRAGGRLVTDDMLPVELSSPPSAHPGVHAVRLWEDSADHVGTNADFRMGVGGKFVLDELADESRMDHVTPLLAVYLLSPVMDDDAPAVERRRTNPVEGSMALMGQNKIGPLLAGIEAPVLLERSIRLADLVPVYELKIARDFDRLPEVVSQIQAWHEEDGPLESSDV